MYFVCVIFVALDMCCVFFIGPIRTTSKRVVSTGAKYTAPKRKVSNGAKAKYTAAQTTTTVR